ncbi:uncharacterized protein LOC111691985 [Anoplophora glabripennis]|uniref:uncharacterized protein LOC111691985 n=1 Tax=Anoplophora glabripennis TaxID=217634 RepID=UPI000C7795EE|nr:uncharacterized protein LOC111691985 [Anoplophora glabripennis]
MSPTDFEYCINLIGPKSQKKNTTWREAISVQDRLAVTLRYLATGDSFTSLQYLFRITKQAISKIIPDVSEAIIDGLKEDVKIPTSVKEWMKAENDFNKLWNFPHAIGALDGKHILLQCPFNSGTEFYNYKSHFSIVLLALVDANYNFLYVNIGAQGRISHGGIMNNCSLNTMIQEKNWEYPFLEN